MATLTQQVLQPLGMSGRSDESIISCNGRILPIATPTVQIFAPSPTELLDLSTPTSTISRDLSDLPTSMASLNYESAALADQSKPSSPQTPRNPPLSTSVSAPVPLPAPITATAPSIPNSAAAAVISQPKIVQTAFIHKLYNMLEDSSIQSLISWSPAGESFVMNPSSDFSRVLAQYFKHTNISSFVRQLNMYGFHKVSDLFHSSSPDTALWEFKHGSGNFRRGDTTALRDIKRRASRHSLVHRDYTNQKPMSSMPPSVDTIGLHSDSAEGRIAAIEHVLYDLHARLQKSEDNANSLLVKYNSVADCTSRILQFISDICRNLLGTLGSNLESPICREVRALQTEIQQQADLFHNVEDVFEQPVSGVQSYLPSGGNALDSPRQSTQQDSHRSTLSVPPLSRVSSANNCYRPHVPSTLAMNTRRPYGSIGAASPLLPSHFGHPAQPRHPPFVVEPPSGMPRRHTSADIRAHGWHAVRSPFGPSGPSPSTPPVPSLAPWPSSPSLRPTASEGQHIRDSLSLYSLQTASQPRIQSRPVTPSQVPYANLTASQTTTTSFGPSLGRTWSSAALSSQPVYGNPTDTFGGWSWNSAAGGHPDVNNPATVKDSFAASKRRGSMAHILNPADITTADRVSEDDMSRVDGEKKRKRFQ